MKARPQCCARAFSSSAPSKAAAAEKRSASRRQPPADEVRRDLPAARCGGDPVRRRVGHPTCRRVPASVYRFRSRHRAFDALARPRGGLRVHDGRLPESSALGLVPSHEGARLLPGFRRRACSARPWERGKQRLSRDDATPRRARRLEGPKHPPSLLGEHPSAGSGGHGALIETAGAVKWPRVGTRGIQPSERGGPSRQPRVVLVGRDESVESLDPPAPLAARSRA